MAINTFTFGGVTSSDFGIYISGEALFNAPQRSVEVVQIPGRDGAYILDKGNFENIEVVYRVFNQEKNLSDFRTKLANLRSALCSKVGYQRLTDTFHPTEYRMAAFVDGIEVNPVKYNTASEFEIKFNCKPQRFLTSGETAVAVASGGKVKNPTLFDARPMLEVTGYGTIDIEGQEIVVHNEPIGDIIVQNASGQRATYTRTLTIDTQYANVGDTIECDHFAGHDVWYVDSGKVQYGNITTNAPSIGVDIGSPENPNIFTYGTPDTKTETKNVTLISSIYGTLTGSTTLTVTYDGDSEFTYTLTQSVPQHMTPGPDARDHILQNGDFILHSSQTLLGNPLYIDLDIGEAYKVENGSSVSVNNGVIIPAELPVLAPGENTITYDNTITQFKVVPRWWKV